MIKLIDARIDDRTKPADLERIRRNMFDAISELQSAPFAGAKLVKDVRLANGVKTPIPHNFGRRAVVYVSPQRGVTLVDIEEFRDSDGPDPMNYVVLRASGGDVTVDVVIV